MAAASDLTAQVSERRRSWEEALHRRGLAVPEDADFLAALPRVWEASDYVAQTAIRHPKLLPDLQASGRLQRRCGAAEMDQLLAAALEGVEDEVALAGALRRLRRREMVRIIWRDIAGLAPLAETLEDLTALADACVSQALVRLQEWAVAELGTPRDAAGKEQGLLVLGMGKLGAREAESVVGHRPDLRLSVRGAGGRSAPPE